MGNIGLRLLLLWWSIYTCNAICHQSVSYDGYQNGNFYDCADIDLTATISFVSQRYKIRCHNCKMSSPLRFPPYSNLIDLEIVYSYLPNITLGLFNTADSLKSLTLSSNNISFVEYHAFGGLRQLKSLNLSFNSINDIRLDDLTIFCNITNIDLSFNTITEATFPKTMQTLNLAHNELIIKDGTFSGLQNLIHLDISYNKFKNIPEHAFQDLINLRELNLSGNNLVSIDYASFSGLRRLLLLNVSFNSIDDIPEYVLHDVADLKQLYLNNNNLSEFNVKLVIANLRNLKLISIDRNLWNCNTLSDIIRTLKQVNVEIIPGDCMKPPNILNICCTKDEIQQTFAGDSIAANGVLQTLNNFFNRDFTKSKFYTFFARDYKEQNFWKYFDADFKRADLFQFFDTGFSRSQFYRYFNRDYFNVTFQNKIIDRIDSISPNESNMNVTELKDTLKSMFGELFQTLNKSNSAEMLPGTDALVQRNYPYKDTLLGAMAAAIVLLLLYVVYSSCGAKNGKLDKLKLYQIFKSKTSSTFNEPDIEIL